MPAIGFDISDKSIKFAELKNTSRGLRLGRFGAVSIPAGVVVSGKIMNPAALSALLSKIRTENRITAARVSLPEEQIYLFSIEIPIVAESEIRSSIELQLEEHVPLPPLEVVFDYAIVSASKETYTIFVSAVSGDIIRSYLSAFNDAGIAPLSFELEAQAIARLIKSAPEETYLIIDFGETRTGIAIVEGGIVQFATTLEVGGDAITTIVAKSFNIPFEEAERLKRAYGLEQSNEYKELYPTLLEAIAALRDEVNKNMIYWQTHKSDTDRERGKISRIVLCGGNANLKGLAGYLAASLKTKVELADVWARMTDFSRYIPEMSAEQSQSFSTALGLALGAFDYD